MNVKKRRRKCPKTGRIIESEKYYIDFIDLNGQRQCFPALKNKTKSWEILNKIQAIMDCRKLNKSPEIELQNWIDKVPQDIVRRLIDMDILLPEHISDWVRIDDFIDEFAKDLEIKGCSPKHITTVVPRIRRILNDCNIQTCKHLNGETILSYIKSLDVSDRTKMHYTKNIKQFSKWLYEKKHLNKNVLEDVNVPKVVKIKHKRRPLTEEEVKRLLNTAKTSEKRVCGISGYERYLIYRLAVETGLRANEIRTLSISDLNFIQNTLSIQPQNEKARRGATLPLRKELSSILEQFVKNRAEESMVFNFPQKAATLLKIDLEDAGIPYKNGNGVVDFHSLRHTAATLMALNETSPQICQWIMRHSDPSITQNVYTQLGLHNSRDLVRMPDFD